MGYRHLGAYFNMKCENSVKISLCAYQPSKSPYLRERLQKVDSKQNRVNMTELRKFLL